MFVPAGAPAPAMSMQQLFSLAKQGEPEGERGLLILATRAPDNPREWSAGQAQENHMVA